MTPTIICIYSMECKFCQVTNDFLEYLSSKNNIKYIKININKMVGELLSIISIQNIRYTKIFIPCIYLLEEGKLILLNNTSIVEDSIKYKNSLINNTSKKNKLFDNIMLNN